MTTDELTEVLEALDVEWYAYSGRAMYGKRCPAVNLPSFAAACTVLMGIGRETTKPVVDLPQAVTDNMGRGIVLYWPTMILEQS